VAAPILYWTITIQNIILALSKTVLQSSHLRTNNVSKILPLVLIILINNFPCAEGEKGIETQDSA